MPGDAERCRDHAKECWAWAADTPKTQASERALLTSRNVGHVWSQSLRQPAFFSRKSEGSPPQQKLARSQ